MKGGSRGDMVEIEGRYGADMEEIWGEIDLRLAHVDAHVERQPVARVIGARRAQHNTLAPGGSAVDEAEPLALGVRDACGPVRGGGGTHEARRGSRRLDSATWLGLGLGSGLGLSVKEVTGCNPFHMLAAIGCRGEQDLRGHCRVEL